MGLLSRAELKDGYHHVNCQPEEYWIEKLASIGFALDAEYTKLSRGLEMHRDAYWQKTGLIFTKEGDR